MGDSDLNAVVATLRMACSVPIAVINIVTQGMQTYPAELGVGAPCTTVPDTVSFCAEVVNTQSPLAVSDARSHPVYAHNPMVMDGVVGSYAGVPLVDDGFVLGSVSIFDDQPRKFTTEELEMLEHLAHLAHLASAVLRLRRTSRTDALTGLPNRALFLDRLDLSLKRLDRQDARVAVMFLDLDGFKVVNDSMGHDAGDQVLVELTRRLTTVLRPTDTIARLGGDEFAALCEGLAAVEDVERIAERILEAIDLPWVINGSAVDLGVSIGIIVTKDADAEPADLIRAADAAMYRAKRIAGSAWVREQGLPPDGMLA